MSDVPPTELPPALSYDEKIAQLFHPDKTRLNTWIFFLARAHPKGSSDDIRRLRDLRGNGLRRKDIVHNTEVIRLRCQAYFEHEFERVPVGYVFGAVIDDDGSMVVMGYLDISIPTGYIVFLEHKALGDMGMSVTIGSIPDEETDEVLSRRICEISFTRRPIQPGTGIIFMAGMPESLRERELEFRALVSNFGPEANGMFPIFLFILLLFHPNSESRRREKGKEKSPSSERHTFFPPFSCLPYFHFLFLFFFLSSIHFVFQKESNLVTILSDTYKNLSVN